MNNSVGNLWIIGIIFLAVAALGVAIKIYGIEFPALTSLFSRITLAIIGFIALMLGGILYLRPTSSAQQPIHDTPAVETTVNTPETTTAPLPSAAARVVKNITVGKGPFALAVSPNGSHVYVANIYSDFVSVIDTVTGIASAIQIGYPSRRVAITSNGRYVYVTPDTGSNEVSVIDTASNSVISTIPVGAGKTDGISISPDNRHIYLANYTSNAVLVIDTVSRSVIEAIPVGIQPKGVAITKDGRYVYVANASSDNISVIDTVNNTVNDSVPVGDGPNELASTPDGRYVYVTNVLSNDVSVIGVSNNTAIANIRAESAPRGISIDSDGRCAYIVNSGAGTASVVDTNSNTVIKSLHVGSGPKGVAIALDGHHVYVTNFDSNRVTVIDVNCQ